MDTRQHDLFVQEMSDQDVTNRYAIEMLKLKTLNQFGRHSARFLGSPNTLMMKRWHLEWGSNFAISARAGTLAVNFV